jgi:hypothetical protein
MSHQLLVPVAPTVGPTLVGRKLFLMNELPPSEVGPASRKTGTGFNWDPYKACANAYDRVDQRD